MTATLHSEEKIIKANDIEINYDTFGDPTNPAMLLIMGLGSQMIVWADVFCQALATNGFWVIRFDNRDVGLSTKLENSPVPNVTKIMMEIQQGKKIDVPYKLSDMAKDTVGLLDALKINSAHIVGVSMGGMIAQTIAIEYPNRVKTLTSISSTTGNPTLPQAKPEAMSILTKTPPKDRDENIEYSIKTWQILQGPIYPLDEDFIRKRSGLAYDRSYYPDGTARQLTAILASGSRNNVLKNVTIPTLIIHGDADPLIPVEGGKDTAQSIPNAKLVIIEGMGHSIPVEIAPQIISAIINHAKKVT